MGVTAAAQYLDKDFTGQGTSTAMSMFFAATAVASGLLVAQGVAVAVAALEGWCGAHGTAAMRRQQRAREERRKSMGIVDSVYF